MPFPKEMLNDNEEIVVDLRPHWWYITPQAAALAASVLLGIVVVWKVDWAPLRILVGLVVLAALAMFITRYIRWAGINFVVTTERVISRTGVIAKSGIEIPLDRINTVFFNQSLLGRLIGAGDLGIESAGEHGGQTFEDIRRPRHVQQAIYRAKEIEENNRINRMGAAVAGGTAAASSIPDQIEKLDQLRRQGVLTDAEFNEKKQTLLDRM